MAEGESESGELRRVSTTETADGTALRTDAPPAQDAWQHNQLATMNALIARAQSAESRLSEAVEALKFYADESNYDQWAPVECRITEDGEDGGCEYDKGRIARDALASLHSQGDS